MPLKLLRETISNLFKKPITIEYPKVLTEVPENYRGKHRVNYNKCVGCSLCAIDCPTGAITMKVVPERKKRYPMINYSKCIFCYQCVYVCPVKAYVVSNDYRLATSDKDELIQKEIKV
mgnify:CR=1 FL=1